MKERWKRIRYAALRPCGLAVVAGALGLLLATLLFYPLLRGNVYLGSDLGAYHLPVRAFYSHCLKAGLRFYWWPDQFCGYYLLGEGQGGMFHPFHWVIYRFLPLDWAFNIEFASGYIVAYGGVVALLRRWRLPWHAALFGANLFAFSGFTLIHFMHMQAIAIIAHLPWMLLTVDVLLFATAQPALARAWVSLVLLTASQLLLGYPQYVLFTLLSLALYVLVHLKNAKRAGRATAAALALILGLLVAGVQILPTFDVLQTALRQANAGGWRSGSMHPLNLLQWSGPSWFENHLGYGIPPHEYGLYAGTVPCLMGLWMMFSRRTRNQRDSVVLFLGIQVAIALLLALGEYGGLYGILAKIPVIGSFRCSARHIVLIHFALAVLAAFGLERLGSQGPRAGQIGRLPLVLAGLSWAMIALVLALRTGGSEALRGALTGSPARLLVGPLLMTVVATVIYRSTRYPVLALAALMALSTIDMGFYALPWIWGQAPQSSALAALERVLKEELPNTADPQEFRDFRAHGNWRVARLTEVGLSNYMGYVGLPPAWWLDPDADVTKRLAGVRWEKRPFQAQAWTVHEDALPRARFVAEAIVLPDPSALPGDLDVARVATTETPVTLEPGTPGTVTWKRANPGDVLFETTTESRQLFVFAERYHSGWHVALDGASIPRKRVYGDFMGCVVPAGVHVVSFYFDPPSVRFGAMLSVLGLALTAAGALLLQSRRIRIGFLHVP